jgi:hypothetical protein
MTWQPPSHRPVTPAARGPTDHPNTSQQPGTSQSVSEKGAFADIGQFHELEGAAVYQLHDEMA